MTNEENLIIDGINEFNRYVEYVDKLIRSQYTENINPIKASTKKLIARQGTIKDNNNVIEYRFHGRGCCFIIDSRIVDFDYFGDDWVYEGFGIHKLHHFLMSSEKYKTFENLEFLISLIEILESKRILHRVNPPYATFNLDSKYRITAN